jgi:hypothetical protein
VIVDDEDPDLCLIVHGVSSKGAVAAAEPARRVDDGVYQSGSRASSTPEAIEAPEGPEAAMTAETNSAARNVLRTTPF